MSDIFKRLAAPFPPERVSWRIGSTTKDKTRGMALAYIDARDVMERLDYVIGPGGWQNRYPHANGKTVCEIGINLQAGKAWVADSKPMEFVEQWVWKSDGAGDSDIEAEKGALSDAFKRAAVRWGIGRYLYDLPSPWVELDGRNIAAKEMPKLKALLRGAELLPAAKEAAAKGVEFYKAHYLALPIADREALSEYHADLKTAALAVTGTTEKAA